MPRNGLVRLALLSAIVVCALIGFRLIPAFAPASGLGREPALIVNDTAAPVVVFRCLPSCAAATGGVSVARGASLRLGGNGEWVIESPAGERLGCIDTAVATGRQPAAKWRPCRP